MKPADVFWAVLGALLMMWVLVAWFWPALGGGLGFYAHEVTAVCERHDGVRQVETKRLTLPVLKDARALVVCMDGVVKRLPAS